MLGDLDNFLILARNGMKDTHLHTSGHADQAALQRMVEALKPKKIIPIHTFERDLYESVFIGESVKKGNDGEVVTIEP